MMNKTLIFSRSRRLAAKFRRANGGNVAVMFAIAILPIMGFVGAAVDYTRVNNARTAMQAALDTTALDALVTRLMQEYDIPGAGLAIVQNGRIAYTKGYGVRDVTTGAPVTPNTQFAIASNTKSFTALGVMLLVQQGKVKLDEGEVWTARAADGVGALPEGPRVRIVEIRGVTAIVEPQ